MSPKEIEDYLWRLQQSTRASSKLMIPWHDYLRLRFKWYYNWHLNPWTSKIHVSILGAYLLALIVGISLNFLTFSSPAPTHAAGQMQMASGSYAGNNVDNRSINGLGFKPDLVIVKSSSATDTFRTGWWRSSAMTGDDSASFYKEANSSNQIQSLDDDGFTVGNSLWINQNGQTYYWEAFKDNGGGDFKVGSYDGDSTDNRDITGFGFRPDLVVIKPSTVESHSFWRTSSQVGDVSQRMWAGQPVADNIQDFTDDGFQVGTAINTAATKHYYFAFKQVEGYFKVGTYTGDGTDDRNISGVGFQPDMLWVQQSQVADNKNIYYKPSALTGDAALTLINSNFAAPNYIQSLQADGFQVGTMLNTTPRLHLYAAWKNYAGMSNNRIWDGGGGIDTSWSNCTNWSDDICPTEAMSVLFDSTSSNNSTIDLQGTVANLSIDSGYTGTITVSSNIAISKNLNFGSGSLDAGSNTISIGGNAIFTGGVFNGNNASINVGGDWSTANENIFIAGTSTVNLTGGDQQILGTTTFNNLSKTTANACILRIQSSATQVINGALTFTGSSGNVLSLRPTTANTSWGFDPRGSRSIAYVDVQYGNNINVTPIELNLSTNSGNNTGDWTYINRLTQAIVGNGPFVMNLSNSEYILEENVTFPGTGLIMAGSNITLNLNNKTLSYGNTSMQDFPNFDFETDDLSSWTFSNGTFARSSATNRTMMNNWRISATDLAATGDIITSGWISLPTANKTYVGGIIGALDSNQGINVQVSIDIKANADNSITMGAWTSPDIGLWHAPFASVQFKPVNISDYTFRLRITKTGGTGTLASFDYAKIRPAYDAGVVLYSTYENTQFPDLASYPAAGPNFVIKNGAIIQSQESIYAKGIAKDQNVYGEIYNATISNTGIDSTNFWDASDEVGGVNWNFFPNQYISIHDSHFISNSNYVVARDNLTGFPVMLGSHTRFFHNTIDGGQGGIYGTGTKAGEKANDIKIYENDAAHNGSIKIKQYVTNHYSIETYGSSNIEIYNNDITTTEEGYWGRGVHVGEKSENISVHNNNLSLKVQPNPEYPSLGSHGTHGIKLEKSNNSEVYDNNVTVYSTSATYAAALDVDMNTLQSNSVHNNNFIAINPNSAAPLAYSFRATGVEFAGLTLKDNKFIANKELMYFYSGGTKDLQFKNNTFACGTSVSERCQSLPADFKNIYFSSEISSASNFKIINPILEGGVDFKRADLVSCYGTSSSPYEYFLQWPVMVTVKDQSNASVSGATVTVSSPEGNFVGTTDGNGQVQLNLSQLKVSGVTYAGTPATATSYNPYYVSAAKTGYDEVAGVKLTMNEAKSMNITLAISEPPVISDGMPTNTLSSNITSASLAVATNEAATCKYSTTAGTAYASMIDTFSTTGNTTHSTMVSGLSAGNTYTYFVRCQDTLGNSNTDDYTINFSIAGTQNPSLSPSTPTPTTAPAISPSPIPNTSEKTEQTTNNSSGTTELGTVGEESTKEDETLIQKIEKYFATRIFQNNGKEIVEIVKIQIVDKTGNPIPNLDVTIHSNTQTSKTNENGVATFNNVPVGKHRLVFALSGEKFNKRVTIDDPNVKEGTFQAEILTIKAEKDPTAAWVWWVIGSLSLLTIVSLGYAFYYRRRKTSY